MHCDGCGTDKAYWIGIDAKNNRYCSECSNKPSPNVSNLFWSAQKQRIYDKATKNLKNGKHIYVPPRSENEVGGVFEKR